MRIFDRSRRHAVVLLLLLTAFPAQARKSESWARTQFGKAERIREALNGRPAPQRTRREYQRAVNAYRAVYYGAPASSKADPSVVAVAELLVEMGRRFDDSKILRSAIGQYQFLRREYPGSKYRFGALFTVGEIYKDDLDDPKQARATFEEFLRRYPRNHLADEARKALAEPAQQASLKSKDNSDDDDSSDSPDKNLATPSSGRRSVASAQVKSDKLPRVTGVRHWSTPDYTRVAIDVEQDVKFESHRLDNPQRIVFDLLDTRLASTLVGKTFDADDGFLKTIRVAQSQSGRTRVVLEVEHLSDYHAFLLSNPSRLVVDIHGDQTADAGTGQEGTSATKPGAGKAAPLSDARSASSGESKPATAQASSRPAQSTKIASTSGPIKKVVDADDDVTVTKLDSPGVTPAGNAPISPALNKSKASASKARGKPVPPALDVREARPTASGDRSLIRALGLKIGKIVIDPGHGGYDTGTIGPRGLAEKDLVLDVGKRLGKLLETRLGAGVVYTRSDDTFIPLETRTAMANQEQADLFVSIHANSSNDSGARGVETYYLNFTSSPDALEVAARENAVSGNSIHELQDLVKKIALKEKIEESREFASDVQQALHNGLAAKSPGIRDRGVKKAPFIVLIGANMPSILAEISFVSNPGDERRLQTPEYRQRIAESLYRGIAKYVSGLSGVKVASRIEKDVGQ